MTTKDTALRLALEALEQCGSNSCALEKEAIAACREALEQPSSPVALQWLAEMIMSDCGCSTTNQRLLERVMDRINKYERANTTAQPAGEQQEPVAWQPIETAPKDGTLIVARGNNHGNEELGQHHCIACWYGGVWAEASDWNPTSHLTYLTHWIPLPPTPGDTAPQPAAQPSEWVGLSEKEVSLLWKRHNSESDTRFTPYEDDGLCFSRAIEALLREKNAGKPAAEDKAGGDEPVATKKMRDWVEYLKRQSDNGAYRNIPSAMSSGRCWELANELEQFLNTRPQPQAELNSWSVLAARALDDAHRVLETIEPETSSEADSISELSNRVQELFVQALVLHGFKTRKEMDAAKHFNRVAINTAMLSTTRPQPQGEKE